MSARSASLRSSVCSGAARWPRRPRTTPSCRTCQNPSTKTRIKALRQLGDAARTDAAAPMAALLLDGNDNVQFEAITALLTLYTVRDDLRQPQVGRGHRGGEERDADFPEVAFEAGPLATIPAARACRGRHQPLVGHASGRLGPNPAGRRLCARRARGAIDGAAGRGRRRRGDQQHRLRAARTRIAATRQVVARVAGRIFAPAPGATAPATIGDAMVASMNDPRPAGAPLGDGLAGLASLRPRRAGADRPFQLLRQDEEGVGRAPCARPNRAIPRARPCCGRSWRTPTSRSA